MLGKMEDGCAQCFGRKNLKKSPVTQRGGRETPFRDVGFVLQIGKIGGGYGTPQRGCDTCFEGDGVRTSKDYFKDFGKKGSPFPTWMRPFARERVGMRPLLEKEVSQKRFNRRRISG